MKKTTSVFSRAVVSVFAALFILVGCSDPLTEPASPDSGFGTVIVNFDGGSERTIVPGGKLYDLYYVLKFTSAEREPVEVKGTTTSVRAKLLPGTWTLDVKGYVSEVAAADPANAVVSGAGGPRNFTVIYGRLTELQVYLTPNADKLTQAGSGKLALTVQLPAGASGSLMVLTLDEAEVAPATTLPAGTTKKEIELPSGFYHVLIIAELNGKEIVRRELAQIFDNAISTGYQSFSVADFTQSRVSALISGFSLGVNTYAYIDDNAGTISVIVPPDTDITSLSPTIEFEGAVIKPAPGGTVDLSTPISYTVYAANGEEKTYTVTAADTIESAIVLAGYLGSLAENTAAGAYPVKVILDLDTEWQSVLSALGSARKYVDLDISESWRMETFDPGTANTGEKYIAALVLPDTTTATSDASGTPSLFQYFTSLAAIKGAGLKTLGAGAFKELTYSSSTSTLESYDFPALESIGAYAFWYCGRLTTLTIPASVRSIGEHAFFFCSRLSGTLTIPASVNSIGEHAFRGCSGLTGSLTIPAGVTIIKNGTFRGCSGLTGSLTIPTGVTTIESSAFNGCSGLSGVTLPDSVTEIGSHAFNGCSGLSGALIIPAGVRSISERAFFGCSKITALTISDGVGFIGTEAFSGCSKLSGTLTIPGSVYSIGTSSFNGCSGLTGTLTIPGSVYSIGTNAFNGCSGLTALTISHGNSLSIGDGAFSGCSRLTALTIPENVYHIGSMAFYGYKDTKVIFDNNGYYNPGTISSLASDAFPGDLAAKYKAGKHGTYTRPNSSSTVWTKQP